MGPMFEELTVPHMNLIKKLGPIGGAPGMEDHVMRARDRIDRIDLNKPEGIHDLGEVLTLPRTNRRRTETMAIQKDRACGPVINLWKGRHFGTMASLAVLSKRRSGHCQGKVSPPSMTPPTRL